MHFSNPLVLSLSVLGFLCQHQVWAAPATDSLEKRQGQELRGYPGMTLWPDAFEGGQPFRQTFWPLPYDKAECLNVPAWLNDKASSWTVYNGYCQFFVDSGCRGDARDQGTALGQVGAIDNLKDFGFNDRISSYKCWYPYL